MSYQPIPTSAEDDTFAAGEKGLYVLGVRRDSDTAPVADGRLAGLTLDEEGRLKTSNKTASFSPVVGNLTAVGNTIVVDVRRASNIVFHAKNTGSVSMAAGAFIFEASIDSTDGTNGTWFTIQAVQSNANTIVTASGTLSLAVGIGLAYSYEASVNAYQFARIRCTTATTASSIATWTVLRGSYATEPIPAAQATATQPVSGTLTSAGTVTPAAPTTTNTVTTASTNAAVIKATAGSLYEVTISNPTATPIYVKFYNKTTAPTVGTDVPVLTIPVPASATNAGTESYVFGSMGKRFSSGIGIATTAAAVATDTAVAVAGVQLSTTWI